MKKQLKTDLEKSLPSEESYLNALQKVEFLLESIFLPILVVGETAKRIRNHEPLQGLEKLEFGIAKNKMSKFAESSLKSLVGPDWETQEHEGVKVDLILLDETRFIERPDSVVYMAGFYQTPNPFDEYWEAYTTK